MIWKFGEGRNVAKSVTGKNRVVYASYYQLGAVTAEALALCSQCSFLSPCHFLHFGNGGPDFHQVAG